MLLELINRLLVSCSLGLKTVMGYTDALNAIIQRVLEDISVLTAELNLIRRSNYGYSN